MPTLKRIVPYEPGAPIELVVRRFGLDEVVKPASNELPLPPFEAVRNFIAEAIDELNRYPDGAKLGCPGWARVSVGTRGEIDFFLDKVSAVRADRAEPAFQGG